LPTLCRSSPPCRFIVLYPASSMDPEERSSYDNPRCSWRLSRSCSLPLSSLLKAWYNFPSETWRVGSIPPLWNLGRLSGLVFFLFTYGFNRLSTSVGMVEHAHVAAKQLSLFSPGRFLRTFFSFEVSPFPPFQLMKPHRERSRGSSPARGHSASRIFLLSRF